MKADLLGVIGLTVMVEKDGDQFAAHCVELGTVSCGDTLLEAAYNIFDAVQVHLNALEAAGEVERVFQERGIKVLPASELEGPPEQGIEMRLPLPSMLSAGFMMGESESVTPDPEAWFAQGLAGRPVKFPVHA